MLPNAVKVPNPGPFWPRSISLSLMTLAFTAGTAFVACLSPFPPPEATHSFQAIRRRPRRRNPRADHPVRARLPRAWRLPPLEPLLRHRLDRSTYSDSRINEDRCLIARPRRCHALGGCLRQSKNMEVVAEIITDLEFFGIKNFGQTCRALCAGSAGTKRKSGCEAGRSNTVTVFDQSKPIFAQTDARR